MQTAHQQPEQPQGERTCPTCRGERQVRTKGPDGQTKTQTCIRCRGTGKVSGDYKTK